MPKLLFFTQAAWRQSLSLAPAVDIATCSSVLLDLCLRRVLSLSPLLHGSSVALEAPLRATLPRVAESDQVGMCWCIERAQPGVQEAK